MISIIGCYDHKPIIRQNVSVEKLKDAVLGGFNGGDVARRVRRVQGESRRVFDRTATTST